MNSKGNMKDIDPRRGSELTQTLALVNDTVDKQYVSMIKKLPIFEPSFEIARNNKDDIGSEKKYLENNAKLVELERFVFDEDEKIQDKLISVYQAVASYENAKLFMLIRSNETEQKIYLGVANNNTNEPTLLEKQLTMLIKNITGNFPGTKLKEFQEIPAKSESEKGKSAVEQQKELLIDVFGKSKNIASISGIPAIKSEKREENKQFTQGIEKFMDSILGEKVDVLILAEPVLPEEIVTIKNGYQEIYSNLSPYSKSVMNITKTNGDSITETVTKGITDTTNESVAKTQTHTLTQGTNSSTSVGGHIGHKAAIVDLSVDAHRTWGKHKDKSDSDGKTTTEGTSQSLNKQNSVASGSSSSHSDGMQIEYENKSIKSILEKIDCQLERIKECEDYGMYASGVYVLSDEYSSVVSASAAFQSIMRGKESSAEASYINLWQYKDNDNNKVIKCIVDYISTFNHPVFSLQMRHMDELLPVSPSTIISGKELSIQMGMPRKSVSGIPVIKTARFGRNVLYLDDSLKPDKEIRLGTIYHMNNPENTEVSLNAESLTSHVFITGSTGSGKSTTVYKLLKESIDVVDECKFMIIEPAKGEYKTVFGGRMDVTVYGTNFNEVENILKLNPFSFPYKKIHVLEHIDKLIAIFNACWPMYAAMPAVLKDSIERAYVDAGWDLTKSICKYKNDMGIVVYPTFTDVLNQISLVIKESQYSADTKGDYVGALVTRVKTLTNGINGLIFSGDEIKDSKLFDENVIIDLSRISSDETKSLIMGILIIKQQEYRIANCTRSNDKLKHITVLEEAHNILKRTFTEQTSEGANLVGKSVEMLASAIAEMRTYGESYVIVDQSPGAVDASAIRNTNTKIIMRLPDFNDREQIGKSAGLNAEQIAELAKLKTGVAAIYQNNWVDPVLCEVTNDVEEKSYRIPDGYLPDWSGDEETVKEVIDVLIAPFFNDVEHGCKIATKALVQKVLSSGMDAKSKTDFVAFYNTDDIELEVDLAEDIIYRMLSADDIWRKSLAYRENLQEWYRQMTTNIKPDISDLEQEAVDIILQILLYKQEQLFGEQNMLVQEKQIDDILNQIQKSKGGIRNV